MFFVSDLLYFCAHIWPVSCYEDWSTIYYISEKVFAHENTHTAFETCPQSNAMTLCWGSAMTFSLMWCIYNLWFKWAYWQVSINADADVRNEILDMMSNELTCKLSYRHVFETFLSSRANGSTEGWNKKLTMKVFSSNLIMLCRQYYYKALFVFVPNWKPCSLVCIHNVFFVSFVNIMFLKK